MINRIHFTLPHMYAASYKSTRNPIFLAGVTLRYRLVSHQNFYHSDIVTILLMDTVNAAKNRKLQIVCEQFQNWLPVSRGLAKKKLKFFKRPGAFYSVTHDSS